MKVPIGKKMWYHRTGDPTEVVISSHGCRYEDDVEMVDLADYLPGTTVHFVVPDGVPAGFVVRQGLGGGMPRESTHSTEIEPVFYDYYLSKFQKSSVKSNPGRHNPNTSISGLETYEGIQMAIDNRLAKGGPDTRAYWLAQNDKYRREGHFTLVDDFVNRGVITIRSGGRFKQQQIRLSQVIAEVQAFEESIRTFWCLFCRVKY